MTNRVWIPLLASLALVLSACSEPEEDPNVDLGEQESSVADDEVIQNEQAPAAAENAADMPEPAEIEDDVEARQAAEELEQAEALDAQNAESEPMTGEEVQAGEETLAADPEEALSEESAMPGETTRSDVDDVIAETERRFEEAQRQLDQQFQEVERQSDQLDPVESTEFSDDWEVESSLPESARREPQGGALDVDELIEDTERRFEQAQQRLDEQFQELERESSQASDNVVLEPESDGSEAGTSSQAQEDASSAGDTRERSSIEP